jgi:hypothetical protein
MLRDWQKRFPGSFPSRGAPTPLCTPRGLGLSGSMQVRINSFVCAKYRYRYCTVLYVPTVRSFCWYKKCLNLFIDLPYWPGLNITVSSSHFSLPVPVRYLPVLATYSNSVCLKLQFCYAVVDPDLDGSKTFSFIRIQIREIPFRIRIREISFRIRTAVHPKWIWIWRTDKICNLSTNSSI